MLVTSTVAYFIDGRRIRPGEAFELPEGTEMKPHLQVFDLYETKPKVKAKDEAPQTFSEMTKQDSKAQIPKGHRG